MKKRRVLPPGWTPTWRGIAYGSAVAGGGLAGVALVLLIRLLLVGDTGFSPSSWSPAAIWPSFAQSLGLAPAAVPEPSRMVLVFLATVTAMMQRRR